MQPSVGEAEAHPGHWAWSTEAMALTWTRRLPITPGWVGTDRAMTRSVERTSRLAARQNAQCDLKRPLQVMGQTLWV